MAEKKDIEIFSQYLINIFSLRYPANFIESPSLFHSADISKICTLFVHYSSKKHYKLEFCLNLNLNIRVSKYCHNIVFDWLEWNRRQQDKDLLLQQRNKFGPRIKIMWEERLVDPLVDNIIDIVIQAPWAYKPVSQSLKQILIVP